MSWKSIVAGVDDSPEGARSAELAWAVSHRADVECYLVHAAREVWTASGGTDVPIDVDTMNQAVLQSARERVVEVLSASLPQTALARLEVHLGRAAVLLREVVVERDAGLVVVGAKHHRAVTRWVGGSTVHNVVRTSKVPILVARHTSTKIDRVLAAVDISYAAAPTVAEARRFARLFNAELKVVHVIEPLPVIAALPIALDREAYYRIAEERFRETVPGLLQESETAQLVRRGPAEDALAQEAIEWEADILVVGSHGKGWMDRLLVGSTTERLLNRLPTSTLVVPVSAPHDNGVSASTS